MSEKKVLFLMGVVTVVLLGGGVLFLSSTTTSVPAVVASENAKAATLDPTSFDWGTIAYGGTKATKKFTIRNTGTENLKLYNLKTSCHCTKARITIDGIDSPNFGMSGVSDWVGEVAPGKKATLTVVFDQTYHGPSGVGPITRFVSLDTNDRGIPKITYTLSGIVVK